MNGGLPDAADAAVVGGGFFGASLALLLKERGLDPVLLERGGDLMLRASYNNQARVHHGYHYPRSLMTAVRSRVNYPRFFADYPGCIVGGFEKFYAVGRVMGKVGAAQFELFMRRVGAPLEPAPPEVRRRFHPDWIEGVWRAEEVAFDAAKLRELVRGRLREAGIRFFFGTEAVSVGRAAGNGGLLLELSGPGGGGLLRSRLVFNCTYSGINRLRSRSGLPPIPLKHEMTEMALVEPPPSLRGWAVTVMCGPFFSLMPFPDKKLCTLSHVRHTPQFSWEDSAGVCRDPYAVFDKSPKESAALLMLRDAARYLPEIAGSRIAGSIWEIKTLLPQSELDDGRPILFHADPALPGLVSILGGKIDNIYDIPDELDALGLPGPRPRR